LIVTIITQYLVRALKNENTIKKK